MVLYISFSSKAATLTHSHSAVGMAMDDKPFDRLGVVLSLRKLHRGSNEIAKTESSAADEEMKWLSWPVFEKKTLSNQ